MAKLNYRYSSMAAGKTAHLLIAAYQYEERGMKVALFTAAIDDRIGVGTIGSRIGIQRTAQTFDSTTQFNPQAVGDVACVFIDEAQFLSEEQARQLHVLANVHGTPVICFGLRSDFRGKAFPGSAALLTLADDLQEIRTMCACDNRASMNMRVDENGKKVSEGEQIGIGGNDRYRAVCPSCFYSS